MKFIIILLIIFASTNAKSGIVTRDIDDLNPQANSQRGEGGSNGQWITHRGEGGSNGQWNTHRGEGGSNGQWNTHRGEGGSNGQWNTHSGEGGSNGQWNTHRGEGGWQGEGGWRGEGGAPFYRPPYYRPLPPIYRPLPPYYRPSYYYNPYYPYRRTLYLGKRNEIQKETPKEAECRFFPDSSMLSCNGNLVACEAKLNIENLTNSFQMFGIGRSELVKNSSDIEKFKLFPKNLTQLTYGESKVPTIKGKLVDLYLYHSEKSANYGIMIKDAKCFKKIVSFFNAVKKELVVDKMAEKRISKVSLLGYVLNV